jgi:hypothetical protein
MTAKETIELTGKTKEIIELAKEGYTAKEINVFLLTQGFKIGIKVIQNFLKSEEITKKDITKKMEKEEKIKEITYEIPVINTEKLLKDLTLPSNIDTQEKVIETLQKTLIKETLDTWCILTTLKKDYLLGKLDYYPTEIEKQYLMLLDRCIVWLGIKLYIDENEALKIVENLGLEVKLKEPLNLIE